MRGDSSTVLFALFAGLALTTCTYGPAESSARVVQVVRIGTGSRALVVVQQNETAPPTGLSAFPDGGRPRVEGQVAILYDIDGIERTAREVFRHIPSAEQWESFGAWIGGITPAETAYLRFTGCPVGGECHPALSVTSYYRVTASGLIQAVPTMPEEAVLVGGSLAPMDGEEVYLRYSTDREGVRVLSEPDGDSSLIFKLDAYGGLTTIDRG